MFRAEVPLAVATVCAASCAAANAASKRRVYGPRVRAPLASISATAAAISARSSGGSTTRAAGTANAWPLAQSRRGPVGPRLVTGSAFGYRPDLAIIPVEIRQGTGPSQACRRGGTRPQARGYEAGVTGVHRRQGIAGAGRAHHGGAGARLRRHARRPGRHRPGPGPAAVLPPAVRAGPRRSRGGHLR